MSDADQQAVLTLTIQDKSVLYGAYMSFLQTVVYLCRQRDRIG